MQGSPERYRFAHALIRSTIYEGTGAADRASLDQQIGEVFEDLYRADPVPHLDELAYHFRLGARLGDSRKAIDYSRRAAEAAEHAFAYDQSVTHLEAALNLTSSENSDALATRALLLSDLGRAYSLAGLGGPAVVGYADRAIAAYHTLGDVRREASVCASSEFNSQNRTMSNKSISRALDTNWRAPRRSLPRTATATLLPGLEWDSR